MSALRIIPVVALALCLSSSGQAAVIITIDLDRNTPGIQSNIAAIAGQDIQGAIVLEVTGVNATLAGYNFGMRFRTDELDLGDNFSLLEFRPDGSFFFVDLPGRPTPPPVLPSGTMQALKDPSKTVIREDEGMQSDFTDDSGGAANPGNAGIFVDISAGALSGATITGTVASIYEFNLKAVNPTGDASVLDIVPILKADTTAFIDVAGSPLTRDQITLLGASVSATAVPEPSTMAFLGLGTLFVAQRRYKRRKAAASAKA